MGCSEGPTGVGSAQARSQRGAMGAIAPPQFRTLHKTFSG